MNATPTPIRWDQIARPSVPLELAESQQQASSPAASWGVIAQDGSRREATSSSQGSGSRPLSGPTTGPPTQKTGGVPLTDPAGSPRSDSQWGEAVLANLSSAKKVADILPAPSPVQQAAPKEKTRGATARGASPLRPARGAALSLSGTKTQTQAAFGPPSLSGARAQIPTVSGDQNLSAYSAQGKISAADLVASLCPEKVAAQEEESSFEMGARGSVEMPPARPTLSEEPADGEAFLEDLALESAELKRARHPGVDGQRPFERVPIDPPTPREHPTLKLSSLGRSSEDSRSAATSVAMIRGKLDPQLTRVMDAWPTVPQRTREAILAMIDISVGKR